MTMVTKLYGLCFDKNLCIHEVYITGVCLRMEMKVKINYILVLYAK